jgi:UDP-3-O-[3-hydroxymyristoyl] glucosamine N-acyltransferase
VGAARRLLAELAEAVGGRVEGDPRREVEAIRALDAAGPSDLSFLNHIRYRRQAEESRAGVLMVTPALLAALAADPAAHPGRSYLLVDDPPYALARLLEILHPEAPEDRREPGVHPTAVLEPGCEVDPTAHVGPCAVIGAGSRIGARAAVHALAVVGRGCTVGEDAVLYPHAVLYDGTELGARVRVHAGAVLGADGFGYATHGGVHHKVPQVGRVVVGADVEVGALSSIDRATLGETRIGDGTKIDNLVQVGHNVQVGKHCILCGQAGIAGSTHLGDYVVLAGQVGVGGHIQLGDGVQAAAKSAVLSSVEPGRQVAGIPATDLKKWRRQAVLTARLEEMNRRIRDLERRLGVEAGDPSREPSEGPEGPKEE